MPRATTRSRKPKKPSTEVQEQARRLQEAMRLFSIKLFSLMNNVLSRGQLNLPQYNALKAVALHAPLSMGKLTEDLCVSTAAATNVVDRLVQLGLVERRRDERDRRVVLVTPTAKGRRTVRGVHQDVGALFVRLLERLSAEERREFLQVYERMTGLVWEMPLEVKSR